MKKKNEKFISIKDASKLLGIDPQVLRIGLQKEKFPFGWAIPNDNGRFTYYIPRKLLKDYIG